MTASGAHPAEGLGESRASRSPLGEKCGGVPPWISSFHEQGFALLPGGVPADLVEALLGELGADLELEYAGGSYGAREICDHRPGLSALLNHPALRDLVEPVLGNRARAVKATVYDKTPDLNWEIAWHQDVAIGVRERREVAGFGWWTERAGVPHVQPPRAIRSEMVALRVHLDPCGPEHGPLRVLRGSHREGKLGPERALWHLRSRKAVECCLPRGGVLLMRPLLLHASSAARFPARRRVLHVEFAAGALPGGLRWQMDGDE